MAKREGPKNLLRKQEQSEVMQNLPSVVCAVVAAHPQADLSDVDALVDLVTPELAINGLGRSTFVLRCIEDAVRRTLHDRIETKVRDIFHTRHGCSFTPGPPGPT